MCTMSACVRVWADVGDVHSITSCASLRCPTPRPLPFSFSLLTEAELVWPGRASVYGAVWVTMRCCRGVRIRRG